MKHKLFNRSLMVFTLIVLGMSGKLHAQEVGLSFSYFLPKDGYFSTPISPFSIRGLGFNFNNYFGFQGGASLYRMSGLNVKGMGEIETKDAIMGPNFTLLIPLELMLQFVGQRQEFRIKGGGFGFYGFDNKLNYGNLDRAIKNYEGWAVANADFSYQHGIGLGYQFGAEYIVYVTRQWGLSLEANYYIGDADLGLKGSYTGAPAGGTLQTKEVDFPDSKVDFTGLEISISILLTQ